MTTAVHIASRACFQRGCSNDNCARLNRRYENQLRLDHMHGRRRTIDASQTRTHIERLLANKWIDRQIAEAAHVSRSAVRDVARGQAQVRATTAIAILAIRIGPPPVEVFGIDSTGTVRRIRALMVLGHTTQTISTHTRIGDDKLQRIAAGWFPRVSEQDARTIARAYRTLIATPGRSARTRAHARNKGWHGPLAWDAIDDPTAQPEKSRNRHKPGPGRKASVDPERVAELTTLGKSAKEIALQLGCHERTVTRARGRIHPDTLKEAA
ncbi:MULTISPECIES: hypothetical protein [unclassified Streptomyces]|uniref:hypothetical protein n=1 Tax=unclassified Streptomyces TaxID=2593676 RepID=UPI00278C3050|nr:MULTISPECIES: hypothetical protein [unclassified Streptomyces]